MTDTSDLVGKKTFTEGHGLFDPEKTDSLNAIMLQHQARLKVLEASPGVAPGSIGATQLASNAVTTVKILNANVTTAKLATGAVTANELGAAAVTTAKILDANVTTAKLAPGAATGAKLAPTGIVGGSFAGVNNAGPGVSPCTLTGALVGQRVLALWEIDTSSGTVTEATKFEATITVNDQIQQSSVSNLSAKKYAVILLPAAS